MKKIPEGNGSIIEKNFAALLKASTDRESGSGRKSKTTVLPLFPTSVQDNAFDVYHE